MSNATIRTIVGSIELLVLLFLVCLSVVVAAVQAQRKPAAKKLVHVALMMRVVGMSALAFGSVLIPFRYSGYGAASMATGVVLVVGATLGACGTMRTQIAPRVDRLFSSWRFRSSWTHQSRWLLNNRFQ